MEDSSLKRANGSAIMAAVMDRPDLLWDWYNDDRNMSGGFDLFIQHLAYMADPDEVTPVEPSYLNRVMYDAGQSVFRSGWDDEAIWVMMSAEHGSVRMTVHDHVDAGSFVMSAYGDHLLLDPGYYKPNVANNAITAQAWAHNLLIIEDEPVPPKGLLTNFGDTDAFLENEILAERLQYVEAWQPIDASRTERSLMMLHNRYVAVIDRVVTEVTVARKHTWRLNGWAGFDCGGTFSLDGVKASWEREKGGVEVYLANTAEGLQVVEPPYVKNDAPFVTKITGDLVDHAVIDGVVTAVKPIYAAVVAPFKVGAESGSKEDKLTVTQISATGVESGVAVWKVEHVDGTDLIIARDPEAPTVLPLETGETITTDGEFAVVSIQGANPIYLLGRGTELKLDDTVLFENNQADVISNVE